MVRFNDDLKEHVAEISTRRTYGLSLPENSLKFFLPTRMYIELLQDTLRKAAIIFVITPKNQRPLKAVLKGLPVSYSSDEIAEGLSELGLKLDQVRQLTNLKTKAPIPCGKLLTGERQDLRGK
ncbi:hypothetical protein CEXT_316081 [Caerostris extrusa]|uniref:Uncharacterized protein n=1 Tax=Caerostris extrusa TaxID=172846 RepID=A0AAV4X6J2_CAEEX|nr:hypothetical protein CEXT_316081 [Caerostris extrusa]